MTMMTSFKWSVHNPYFNYFWPETFYVSDDTNFPNRFHSDSKSRPLETYLPDDYIKYKKITYGSVGFAGKELLFHYN